ncbi:MAG: phosphoadenosine phosphosulfate reductase family protein [Prevotella sp.]|nr:phosphoadenosine phosphosulfate reductase family protein [Prevotella sp.]
MNKPSYADFDPAAKFQAIQSIIASKLTRYPKAICSYSGGSDSDTMLDLIERTRQVFGLKPVKYVFFNTGLEMEATKRHVKEIPEKYGVDIETIRPKRNIVLATREHGLPIFSKIFSFAFEDIQRKNIPLSVVKEYKQCETVTEKQKKFTELVEIFKRADVIAYICSCDRKGVPAENQLSLSSYPFLLDFALENPPKFKISKRCCDECKKKPAHEAQKGFDLITTGERFYEGGLRSTSVSGCFNEQANGQFRLRPLFFVTDSDKVWYKERYGLRYSDAYEVYGMKRTGCCGCSISARAVEDLEIIGQYEPKLKKAAWAVFGDAYRYRQQYVEYRDRRRKEEKEERESVLNAWKPYLEEVSENV